MSMAVSQLHSRRKASGGRYREWRKKKVRDLGNAPTHTKLGEKRAKTVRTTGGNTKVRLLQTNIANVYDPAAKKYLKLKIETIVDNPADRNFIRRNIITKGAIIKTEKGNARVMSRPAQDGIINAVLIKK